MIKEITLNLVKELISKARLLNKTIIFPEADFSDRVLNACKTIASSGIAKVALIGNQHSLTQKIGNKNLKNIVINDPNSCNFFDKLVNIVVEKRKSKGMTEEEAKTLLLDPIYFAVALTECGYADGMVCGAEVSTAKTLRPALQIIKSKEGIVSSYFLFVGKNKVTDDIFMMGDCAVVENPTAEELSKIANLMLYENERLNLFHPRLAFLSYSTKGSANSENIQKVQKAYKMFKEAHPNVHAVGEVQFDASILENVAKTKMPDEKFIGPANMFVMPNIEAGNIGYKLVQYFGGLQAIGPITMGFNKPVNDLSRGCTVDDIIVLTAITVLQC